MDACVQRFLCDEMLARLGRWLRVAGYDVAIASSGESDKALLERALREQRHLLSRDQKLLEHRGADSCVTLLSANTLAGQLQQVSECFSIHWLCRPFTRCLVCNTLLEPATDDVVKRVPPGALREGERVLYCHECDQPYWSGSHVRRMQKKLEQLSLGKWGSDDDSIPSLENMDD